MKIENKSSIIKQFIKIYMTTKKLLLAVLICLISCCFNLSAQTTVQKVNPLLFFSGSSVTVSTIGCTLSNGSFESSDWFEDIQSNNYYPKLVRFGLTLNKLSESVQIFLALKVQIGLKTYIWKKIAVLIKPNNKNNVYL